MAHSQDEYKKDCYDDYSTYHPCNPQDLNQYVIKNLKTNHLILVGRKAQERCGVLKAMPHNFFQKIL